MRTTVDETVLLCLSELERTCHSGNEHVFMEVWSEWRQHPIRLFSIAWTHYFEQTFWRHVLFPDKSNNELSKYFQIWECSHSGKRGLQGCVSVYPIATDTHKTVVQGRHLVTGKILGQRWTQITADRPSQILISVTCFMYVHTLETTRPSRWQSLWRKATITSYQ